MACHLALEYKFVLSVLRMETASLDMITGVTPDTLGASLQISGCSTPHRFEDEKGKKKLYSAQDASARLVALARSACIFCIVVRDIGRDVGVGMTLFSSHASIHLHFDFSPSKTSSERTSRASDKNARAYNASIASAGRLAFGSCS